MCAFLPYRAPSGMGSNGVETGRSDRVSRPRSQEISALAALAEMVGILASGFGSMRLKERDQKGQIK